MPFTIFLNQSSYRPIDAAARVTALNAAIQGINRLRESINDEFGIRNWAAVIL